MKITVLATGWDSHEFDVLDFARAVDTLLGIPEAIEALELCLKCPWLKTETHAKASKALAKLESM